MAIPIRMFCSLFCPLLSVFYKNQNKEFPLRKFEKFSVVLEKFKVSVEIWKKGEILCKGQGNHILRL